MTYREIKKIEESIIRLSAEVACGKKSASEFFTEEEIIQKEILIKELKEKRAFEIRRIPLDCIGGRCLHMKLTRKLTWQQIAFHIGGSNTKDGVRMMCKRFKW